MLLQLATPDKHNDALHNDEEEAPKEELEAITTDIEPVIAPSSDDTVLEIPKEQSSEEDDETEYDDAENAFENE